MECESQGHRSSRVESQHARSQAWLVRPRNAGAMLAKILFAALNYNHCCVGVILFAALNCN